MLMDFTEVMLTSPPKLAHCAPPLPPFPQIDYIVFESPLISKNVITTITFDMSIKSIMSLLIIRVPHKSVAGSQECRVLRSSLLLPVPPVL